MCNGQAVFYSSKKKANNAQSTSVVTCCIVAFQLPAKSTIPQHTLFLNPWYEVCKIKECLQSWHITCCGGACSMYLKELKIQGADCRQSSPTLKLSQAGDCSVHSAIAMMTCLEHKTPTVLVKHLGG